MRRLLLLLLVAGILSGCLIYGEGETNGYITTIEDGIVWDLVWIRADLASSQTTGYAIAKSKIKLKKELQKLSDKKQRVKLKFKNHIIIATYYGSMSEVFFYQILDQI